MHSILITCSLLLLVAVQQGDSIRCYVCNSHKDANCAKDEPPEGLLKDCQEEYSTRGRGIPTYCRKISQVIEFSVNKLPPDSRIIRTCGFQNQTSNNYCYQRAGFGGRQVVCSCDTDKCNGSTSLSTSMLTLSSSLFMAAAMFFKHLFI